MDFRWIKIESCQIWCLISHLTYTVWWQLGKLCLPEKGANWEWEIRRRICVRGNFSLEFLWPLSGNVKDVGCGSFRVQGRDLNWRTKVVLSGSHLKRPWCWERLKVGGEGDDRWWDGWVASPTPWTWVWVNFGSWWWTGRPGVLQSKGLQSRTWLSNWTELNWTDLSSESPMERQ